MVSGGDKYLGDETGDYEAKFRFIRDDIYLLAVVERDTGGF